MLKNKRKKTTGDLFPLATLGGLRGINPSSSFYSDCLTASIYFNSDINSPALSFGLLCLIALRGQSVHRTLLPLRSVNKPPNVGPNLSGTFKTQKKTPQGVSLCLGDPRRIRTAVTAVKGRCPRPLDDRVRKRLAYLYTILFAFASLFCKIRRFFEKPLFKNASGKRKT